jgi:Helix-turn-helix domain
MNNPVICERCELEVTCEVHDSPLKDGLCGYCSELTQAALFLQGFACCDRLGVISQIFEAVTMYDEFDAEEAAEEEARPLALVQLPLAFYGESGSSPPPALLLTAADVAAMLQISRRQLQRYVAAGIIPSTGRRRLLRFRPAALARLRELPSRTDAR